MKVTMKGKNRGLIPWRTATIEVTIEADTIEEMQELLKHAKLQMNIG